MRVLSPGGDRLEAAAPAASNTTPPWRSQGGGLGKNQGPAPPGGRAFLVRPEGFEPPA